MAGRLFLAIGLAFAAAAPVLAKDPAPGLQPQAAVVQPAASAVLPELPELASRPRAIVSQVPDGETLRLSDRRTIRLACIDAPDLALSRPTTFANQELREENFRVEEGGGEPHRQREPGAADQYFAVEAKEALKGLALRQHVVLRAREAKKDHQGRLVADVVLRDGTSLAAYLVKHGFAYVVYDPDFPADYQDALFRLQIKAMEARAGFWELVLGIEAARHPWIGNMETRLFYSGSDVRGQQIKPRLRMYFGTLLDAFSSGYAPANPRNFWPKAR